MLRFEFYKKAQEIPRNAWTKLESPFIEDYDFFCALDESNFPEFTFFYLIIFDGDEPLAGTTLFMMNFPLDLATDGVVLKLLTFFKKFFPRILAPRMLFCGLPMGPGRILIKSENKKVMMTLQLALDHLAQAEAASIIAFKDFDKKAQSMLAQYLDKNFFMVESFPTTEMELMFNDFDHYLKSLSSVSRSGLKRKLKKVDGKVKIDLEVTNQLDDKTLNAIHQLYLQTYQKNEMSLEKITPEFFKKVSEFMPNETKIFLWRINEKIVGFAFCLAKGDHFIDYYLGFDYSVAFDYHLYDIRFRDLMKWCIHHNIKTYEMGQTSYEPKRRLGFKLVPLYFYIKHTNKIMNVCCRFLVRFIRPSNFDPVFKMMKA